MFKQEDIKRPEEKDGLCYLQ